MQASTLQSSEHGRVAAQVWLRGNLRPVLPLAIGVAMVALVAAAVIWTAVGPRAGAIGGLVGAGVGAAVVGVLAREAARPRLVRAGDELLVRLSPATVERVPLAVVECFFPGSQPLPTSGRPADEAGAAYRVNTLVMRLAERATGHARRPTLLPWGTWDEGAVVFDGRWCEPLSAELARGLSRRLVDARRGAAGAGRTGGDP